MATLSMGRALSGTKAFTGVRPRLSARVSNGTKVFMRKKDSFLLEVEVGEDEPEDIAVRKFMTKVVESRVVEKLRAKRYKETPLEEYKRRTRERIELRKAGFIEPTWEELYGQNVDVRPFDEFFQRDPDNELFDMNYSSDVDGSNQWGQYVDGANRGGYINQQPGFMQQGGYIDQPSGGYMNQQGGYMNQGGYINQPGGYINQQGGYINQ